MWFKAKIKLSEFENARGGEEVTKLILERGAQKLDGLHRDDYTEYNYWDIPKQWFS
jgi:hypothetical protein